MAAASDESNKRQNPPPQIQLNPSQVEDNALLSVLHWHDRFQEDAPALWDTVLTGSDLLWVRGGSGIPAFPFKEGKPERTILEQSRINGSHGSISSSQGGLTVCLLVYSGSYDIADGAGVHASGVLDERSANHPRKVYNQTVILPWVLHCLQMRLGPCDEVHVKFIANEDRVEQTLENVCKELAKERVVATASEDPFVMAYDSKHLFTESSTKYRVVQSGRQTTLHNVFSKTCPLTLKRSTNYSTATEGHGKENGETNGGSGMYSSEGMLPYAPVAVSYEDFARVSNVSEKEVYRSAFSDAGFYDLPRQYYKDKDPGIKLPSQTGVGANDRMCHSRITQKRLESAFGTLSTSEMIPSVHPLDWPLLLASGFHLTQILQSCKRSALDPTQGDSLLHCSSRERVMDFICYQHQHGIEALLCSGAVDARAIWWAARFIVEATAAVDLTIEECDPSNNLSADKFVPYVIELYWTPILALSGMGSTRSMEELPEDINEMIHNVDPLQSPNVYLSASTALLRRCSGSNKLLELELETRIQKQKAKAALESLLVRDFQNQYMVQQPHSLVGPQRPELASLPWAMGLPLEPLVYHQGKKSVKYSRYSWGEGHPLEFEKLLDYNRRDSSGGTTLGEVERAISFVSGTTGYPLVDALVRCLKQTGTLPERYSLAGERIRDQCKNSCLERREPFLPFPISGVSADLAQEMSIQLDNFSIKSMHPGLMLLANFWCKYLMLPWGLGLRFIAAYTTEWSLLDLSFVFQWAAGLLLEPSAPSLPPAALMDPQSDTIVDLLDQFGNFSLKWVPELLGCTPGLSVEEVVLQPSEETHVSVRQLYIRQYSCERAYNDLAHHVSKTRKSLRAKSDVATTPKEEKSSKWSFGAMMKLMKSEERNKDDRPTQFIPPPFQMDYAQLPTACGEGECTARFVRNGRVPLGFEFLLNDVEERKSKGYVSPIVDAWFCRRTVLSAVKRLYLDYIDWVNSSQCSGSPKERLRSLLSDRYSVPLLRSPLCHLPAWEADELCRQCTSSVRAKKAIQRLGYLGNYFSYLQPRAPKSDDKAHHEAEKLPFDISDGVIAELGHLWEDREARTHQENIRFNSKITELATLAMAARHLFSPNTHTVRQNRFSFVDTFHDRMLLSPPDSPKRNPSSSDSSRHSNMLDKLLRPIKEGRIGLSSKVGKKEAQLHSIDVTLSHTGEETSIPSCMLAPFFPVLKNLSWANLIPDRSELMERMASETEIDEETASRILPEIPLTKRTDMEIQDEYEKDVEPFVATVQGIQNTAVLTWVYGVEAYHPNPHAGAHSTPTTFRGDAERLLASPTYVIASRSDSSWGCVRGQFQTSSEDAQYLVRLNRNDVYSGAYKSVVDNHELGMHVFMHSDPHHEVEKISLNALQSPSCSNWKDERKPPPASEYMEHPSNHYPSGTPRQDVGSNDAIRAVTGTISLPSKECHKVTEAVVNVTNYRRWDRSWENISELCRLDCHNCIYYKLADTPAPPFSAVVAQRDCVLFRAVYPDSSGSSLAVCFRNGFHCVAPPRHPYIRAVLLGVSGFTITETGNSSSATTFTSNADFRGKVPPFLVNFVAKKSPATWAKRLNGIIRALEEEGYFTEN